jgi:hypothetical protein
MYINIVSKYLSFVTFSSETPFISTQAYEIADGLELEKEKG